MNTRLGILTILCLALTAFATLDVGCRRHTKVDLHNRFQLLAPQDADDYDPITHSVATIETVQKKRNKPSAKRRRQLNRKLEREGSLSLEITNGQINIDSLETLDSAPVSTDNEGLQLNDGPNVDDIQDLQENANTPLSSDNKPDKIANQNAKRNQKRREQRRRKKELKKNNERIVSLKESTQSGEYDRLENTILDLLHGELQHSALIPLLIQLLTSLVFTHEISAPDLNLLSDTLRPPLNDEYLVSDGFHIDRLHEDSAIVQQPTQVSKKRSTFDFHPVVAASKRQKLWDAPVQEVDDASIDLDAGQITPAANEKLDFEESNSSNRSSSCTETSNNEITTKGSKFSPPLVSTVSSTVRLFLKRPKLGDSPGQKVDNASVSFASDQITSALNENLDFEKFNSSDQSSSCTGSSNNEVNPEESRLAQPLTSTISNTVLDIVEETPSAHMSKSNELAQQAKFQPLWSQWWFKWIIAAIPSLLFISLLLFYTRRYRIRQQRFSVLDNNIVFTNQPKSDSINMESDNEDNLFSTSTNMLRRGGIRINY